MDHTLCQTHLKMKLLKRDLFAGHDTSSLLTEENVYTFGMGTNLQLCRRSDTDANIPYRVRTDKFEPAVNKVNNIAFGGQHTLLIV